MAGAESACRPLGENVEGRTFLTLLGFLVVKEVQIFQCGLEGKDRPEAPSECLQCGLFVLLGAFLIVIVTR